MRPRGGRLHGRPAIPGDVAVYLDESQPLEKRVEDALSRLTLEEKVGLLHAQSKFSSAGVPRLGIPEVWCTDGPHGIRPEVLWDEWDQAGWDERLVHGISRADVPRRDVEPRNVGPLRQVHRRGGALPG